MNEYKAILEDLRDYLKKMGIESKVQLQYSDWYIVVSFSPHYGNFAYLIFDGKICHRFQDGQIVSLADPKYREKFVEYLDIKLKIAKHKWKNI